jgi:hypothetical protein
MRRIGLGLAFGLTLVPLVASAQSTKVARVGLLSTGKPRSGCQAVLPSAPAVGRSGRVDVCAAIAVAATRGK